MESTIYLYRVFVRADIADVYFFNPRAIVRPLDNYPFTNGFVPMRGSTGICLATKPLVLPLIGFCV